MLKSSFLHQFVINNYDKRREERGDMVEIREVKRSNSGINEKGELKMHAQIQRLT